jgi:hypothetical protein
MAYIINKFSGEQLIVLEDGSIDTSTSLGLVGRNYVGYGETQNENFVFLLENFANNAPPARPMAGQLWFNTDNNLGYFYTGTNWSLLGAASTTPTPPEQPSNGSLWTNPATDQMFFWNGELWTLIGPEGVENFGTTRARSVTLKDFGNTDHPAIFIDVDGSPIAICVQESFTISPDISLPLFNKNLIKGFNLSLDSAINGNVVGNSATADRLATPRLINGILFNGQSDITLKSSTSRKLIKGEYLAGADFDGSTEITWDVDATPSNVIGKVVARNSAGGFSAGLITASLAGNVTATSGISTFKTVVADEFIGNSLSGNAASAGRLQTARRINGVSFDGTVDVTVSASATTLTNRVLSDNVRESSLNVLGTLVNLQVADNGIQLGSSGQLRLLVDAGIPTIRSITGTLNFDIGAGGPDLSFVNAETALSLGGLSAPSIVADNTTNLGIIGGRFDKVYANEFKGNADTATLSFSSSNIIGGGKGALAVQSGISVTGMLGLGANGHVLRARPDGPIWEELSSESLTSGNFLNFNNTTTGSTVTNFNSLIPVTISVNASSENFPNTVISRNGSGNFNAGVITASLSGNANSATKFQTSRLINGVPFDGTSNITVTAIDPGKLAKAGDAMSGFLTLNADPVASLHATTKQYVDSRLPRYTIISGVTYSTAGFTNQVGSFNNNANYFDVFPPAGKTMANIVAFIPSIHMIHFAGVVNSDDSFRCTYAYLGDRVRVYVQNTEQRSNPAANYLVIWS